MANWSRITPTRKSRLFLVTDPHTGVRQAWGYSFLGSAPGVSSTSPTQASTEDFFSVDDHVLYKNTLTLGVVDFFSALSGSVVSDTRLVADTADFFSANTSNAGETSVLTALDQGIDFGVRLVSGPSRQIANLREHAFSRWTTPEDSALDARNSGYSDDPSTPAGTGGVARTYGTMAAFTLAYVGGTSLTSYQRQSIRFAYTTTRYDYGLDMAWSQTRSGALPEHVTELDVSYELQTGSSTSLNETTLAIQYELLTMTLVESSLDMDWFLDVQEVTYLDLVMIYDLIVGSTEEVQLDMKWSIEPPVFALDFKWSQSGADWISQITDSINTERVAQGKTKMVRAWTPADGGYDIAFRHSQDCLATHVYAHESSAFPPGWQTVLDRLGRFDRQHGTGLENLYGVIGSTSLVNPSSAFSGWMGSPPHYANMMYNWPAESDPVVIVGVDYWGDLPVYDQYGAEISSGYSGNFFAVTLIIIDLNLPGGGVEVQRDLNLTWNSYGALIETYTMGWNQYAFTHVSARHTQPYALHIAVQHEQHWGVKVAAQHEQPIHFTISAQHEQMYGNTSKVYADLGQVYDIINRDTVRASHEQSYAVRMAAQCEQPYQDAYRVFSQHEQRYDQYLKAYAQHEQCYSVYRRVMAAAEQPYTTSTTTRTQFEEQWDIRDSNRVQAQHAQPYVLFMSGATEFINRATMGYVMHKGRKVDAAEYDLSTSEDEYVWVGKFSVTDQDAYASISLGDAVSIVIAGREYVLVVTSKNLTRDSESEVSMTVTAHSPAILLSSPHTPTISYELTTPKMARDIVEEILGQTVDWQILDWMIPAAYFAVTDVEPISAAKTIVESVKGIIESKPDGTLRVRYLFPVSVPDFSSGSVTTLTDVYDALSYEGEVASLAVYDCFRIRDNSGTASDTLEFKPDDGETTIGEIRAWVTPWREVSLSHTGGSSLTLGSFGLHSISIEGEEVEFKGGKATLAYPAVSITSVEWLSDPLGSVILDPRTRDITSSERETNYGYGLARISYTAEYLGARVQFYEEVSTQFILIDEEQ